MHVDRARFLELTLFLATAGCGPEPREAVAPAPIDSPTENADGGIDASVHVASTPDAGPRAGVSTPPVAEAGACDNSIGDLSACGSVDPACEGMSDVCDALTDELRPRVAAGFAACAAKAKPPTCGGRALGACMRRAVESACIEPGTLDRCADIMNACRHANKTPRYSVETCARVLSAAKPGGPNDWDQVDQDRLGPSIHEGCSLEYVLPYQPWGPSWK